MPSQLHKYTHDKREFIKKNYKLINTHGERMRERDGIKIPNQMRIEIA